MHAYTNLSRVKNYFYNFIVQPWAHTVQKAAALCADVCNACHLSPSLEQLQKDCTRGEGKVICVSYFTRIFVSICRYLSYACIFVFGNVRLTIFTISWPSRGHTACRNKAVCAGVSNACHLSLLSEELHKDCTRCDKEAGLVHSTMHSIKNKKMLCVYIKMVDLNISLLSFVVEVTAKAVVHM